MRTLRRVTIAVGMVTALVTGAGAQELYLGAVRTSVDHDLLGTPMGVGVSVGIPVTSRVGVRLGHQSLGNDLVGEGSTCAGLVDPSIVCGREPRDEHATLRGWTLEVPLAALAGERLRVELVPGAQLVRVRSVQVGRTTGRRRAAGKRLYGGSLGVDVGFAPVSAWPVSVRVGGRLAILRKRESEIVADGYAPFEHDIRSRSLEIGLTIG